jgi:hypothetical protein
LRNDEADEANLPGLSWDKKNISFSAPFFYTFNEHYIWTEACKQWQTLKSVNENRKTAQKKRGLSELFKGKTNFF